MVKVIYLGYIWYTVSRKEDNRLSILCMLILASCVIVTISLLPLPTALATKTSTEVNALIQKGNALYRLGNVNLKKEYFSRETSQFQ